MDTNTGHSVHDSDLRLVADGMIDVANMSRNSVSTLFKGFQLEVVPGETVSSVHTKYKNFLNSKKRLWKFEENRRCDALRLQYGLEFAPDHMTCGDKELWKQILASDHSDDGGMLVRFVDRWARLMEAYMDNGFTLEECAQETYILADTESGSGAMVAYAVSAVSKVWVHGEQLLRWHNAV